MVEYHADKAAPKKEPVMTITIPQWLLKVGILLLMAVSAALIAFFGWSMTGAKEQSQLIGAGVIIGFIQLFTFLIYRSFLRHVWGVKED